MASPSRIYTLNVGTQTIGLAEFRSSSGGGLTLHNYAQTEISGELTPEIPRGAQVLMAVKELMATLGIKTATVNYAISSQSVFARFVKLPSVDEEKVEQIIQFEAQQNVPFPINEVVWDYQLVGTGAGDKMEVVLVAIKSDLLGEVNSAVEHSNLTASVVDVAPMALYNAFRYNYSDLDGCSLIVDIGAKTTNLIFNEPGKVFSRSIPIGGNTITQAIAKELNISLGEAETRKKEDGFVSLGGAYADPEDPEVARSSKIIRNTMTRLHAEITRSISFYRSQQQGSQPTRVFLAGGTVSLPYMREFFTEKLQMPIEYLNPLRNVAVTSNIDSAEVGRVAHTMGEMVGLSLRNVCDCPMELNLRPQSVIAAEQVRQKKPYLITAGVCLLLLLGGVWGYLLKAADAKETVLADLNGKVSQLQRLEGKFRKVDKGIKALESEAQPFLRSVNARQYWAQVINDIHSRMPEDFIWITGFEPTAMVDGSLVDATPETVSSIRSAKKGGEKPVIDGIRLRGLYLFNPMPEPARVVDTFREALAESPYISAVENPTRASHTNTEWAYDYEIQVTLKNPLPTE